MPEPRPGRGIVARIYANLGNLLGGKIAAALIGILYLIIAARRLGPADYGVLVLVHGLATTVGSIMEFPCWHAVVRYGAEAREANDLQRLLRLLRFTTLIEIAGGLAAIVTAAIVGALLGARLGWSAPAIAFAVPYSFATLASIRSVPAGYLQLAGRYDLLAAHTIVAPAVRLIGAVIALLLNAGLHGFLIAWLASALFEWAAMWGLGLVVARRELSGAALIGPARGVMAENHQILRFMIGANADGTLGPLANRVAPLVVGWMLGPVAAGFFAIATRVTVIFTQPGQMLGRAAYAELARLVAGGERGAEMRRALLHCIAVALAAALPVMLVLGLFGRDIVVLLGGPGYAAAAGTMLWLAGAQAVLLIAPPVSAALVALGRPGLSVGGNLVVGLVMLPLLPPALTSFGVIGAGVQQLAQAILTAIVLLILFARATSVPTRAGAPLPAS